MLEISSFSRFKAVSQLKFSAGCRPVDSHICLLQDVLHLMSFIMIFARYLALKSLAGHRCNVSALVLFTISAII